jgi:hypothetical protein
MARKKTNRRGDAKGRSRKTPKTVVPKTVKEFFVLSDGQQDTYKRVTHVITKMRNSGLSLQRAAREYAIAPRVVVRLGKSALHKGKNGRYQAKAKDRLLRVLAIPGKRGTREAAFRDSHQASVLAEYWDAVEKYAKTGDASAIKKFRGKHVVDANGKRIRLLTNLKELDRLASAGNFSFESLYAEAA